MGVGQPKIDLFVKRFGFQWKILALVVIIQIIIETAYKALSSTTLIEIITQNTKEAFKFAVLFSEITYDFGFIIANILAGLLSDKWGRRPLGLLFIVKYEQNLRVKKILM